MLAAFNHYEIRSFIGLMSLCILAILRQNLFISGDMTKVTLFVTVLQMLLCYRQVLLWLCECSEKEKLEQFLIRHRSVYLWHFNCSLLPSFLAALVSFSFSSFLLGFVFLSFYFCLLPPLERCSPWLKRSVTCFLMLLSSNSISITNKHDISAIDKSSNLIPFREHPQNK